MTAEADETEIDQTQQSATAFTRPIAKFTGAGGLSVAVWKHKSDTGPDHYSIRIDRTFYRDGSGEPQSTSYLREGDLLRAQKLLGQADDWIEQDRAKYRSAGGQGAGQGRS